MFLAAKIRGIAIPSDLEIQVASMFNKAAMLTRQTSKWLLASKTPKIERSQSQVLLTTVEIPIFIITLIL